MIWRGEVDVYVAVEATVVDDELREDLNIVMKIV